MMTMLLFAAVISIAVLVGFALWRIEELHLHLRPITAQVQERKARDNYELRSRIASDAVAYATQQEHADMRWLKDPKFAWSGDQRKRSAMHFVQFQFQSAGLDWSDAVHDRMAILVETHVAYRDGRATPSV